MVLAFEGTATDNLDKAYQACAGIEDVPQSVQGRMFRVFGRG